MQIRSELELLRREMDLLWQERGGPELVIAVALDGVCVREQLEDALGIGFALAAGSGPSFVIEDHVNFPSTARILRSGAGNVDGLRNANPGNWGADEWIDLLEGRLGGWAIAVVDSRVVSICHTPVSNARAAEAGVWTDAEFRGRGYAAACTAVWAELMQPAARTLFYSTSWTNRSSQRVAARLGLRHIGCTWQLRRSSG